MIKVLDHLYCSEECKDRTPTEFDCFDDGCIFECCGCGACCNPTQCPYAGKNLSWHE